MKNTIIKKHHCVAMCICDDGYIGYDWFNDETLSLNYMLNVFQSEDYKKEMISWLYYHKDSVPHNFSYGYIVISQVIFFEL